MPPADLEAIIGLECHAQLRTASKMFCACAVVTDAPANTAVCPICLGHPGTLPALNAQAVHLALRAAVALGATIHPESRFARKHYFYPDLPKGYQISQYDRPLATGGTVHAAGGAFRLTRIHLEEDAGKMVHGAGTSIDWNRAGVPLIEVVGEPDLRTPDEAEAWLRTLHRVLVEAGLCTGNLEKGHFRCDANVSVHRVGEPWGTRVEIKNVNSFRFVARALRYEIDRQSALIGAGAEVERETRTWAGDRTVSLRKKEDNSDYRYFPEPDLPILAIGPAEIDLATEALPGVPLDRWLIEEDQRQVERWQEQYHLAARDVRVLQADPEAAAIFVAAVAAGGNPRAMANLVQAEVLRRLKDEGVRRLTATHLVEVQALVDAGTISRDGGRALFDVLAAEGGNAAAIASARGLHQISDEPALRATIHTLLARFPTELAKYRAGNRGMQGFFMGQLMTATARKADPQLATRLLREALDHPEGQHP